MLTFIHSPESRSTVIARLLEELGATDKVETRLVTIRRSDSSGRFDPANPHPEAKVPALIHDGRVITERAAIIAHLCALFPEAGLAPRPGSADHGVFLSWLAWYQGVMETVYLLDYMQVDHPVATATFRGIKEAEARIHAALAEGPWLLGEKFSAADLLINSLYAWMPSALPDDPLIRDWSARVTARPSGAAFNPREAAALAKLD